MAAESSKQFWKRSAKLPGRRIKCKFFAHGVAAVPLNWSASTFMSSRPGCGPLDRDVHVGQTRWHSIPLPLRALRRRTMTCACFNGLSPLRCCGGTSTIQTTGMRFSSWIPVTRTRNSTGPGSTRWNWGHYMACEPISFGGGGGKTIDFFLICLVVCLAGLLVIRNHSAQAGGMKRRQWEALLFHRAVGCDYHCHAALSSIVGLMGLTSDTSHVTFPLPSLPSEAAPLPLSTGSSPPCFPAWDLVMSPVLWSPSCLAVGVGCTPGFAGVLQSRCCGRRQSVLAAEATLS
ncbi:uncharacterized protein LOC123369476 isoform X2 [Mauremys mutica]|uniref:uncharacterized protein LOC123369476 isoform X2 n=1 Tax=Mauremys mutica TaxID=74926 RepID=UPI001D16AE36|nr:uncharacterized protein LOC123369476 isoform X2 [Mauremys mutica]